MADFFISYTHADQEWAEWIAWQLEAEHYTTMLQAWDFRPGDNFVTRMRDALQDTNRTIALLSEAYLASDYGTDEWTAAFLHDPDGRQRLLPVRVEPCHLPRLWAALIYIDLVGVDRTVAKRRLLEGVRSGRQRPDQEPGYPGGLGPGPSGEMEPDFPGLRLEISNLPPRNPNFTGRDQLLAELAEQLQASQTAGVVRAEAVYGLGGVGKTQLAIEYAHRHQADYDLIWWVTADQPLAVPAQLIALARRLGIPEQAEQEETIQVLWEDLGRRDRWLLIFDNAETAQDLRPWWPPAGSGQVLLTSRNPAWGGLAAPLRVEVLSRDQSVAFLARRLGDGQDAQALGRLAETLEDLPLALEQAAAYLEETATPIDDYTRLFDQRAYEMVALGQPATTQQTIATTWALSLERIRATPTAQDLLNLCAFLGPEDLPRELLLQHPEVLPQPLAAAVRDQLGFQQALGVLRRYSLLTVTGDLISMHRLVQAVVRHALDPEQRNRWAATAVRLVSAAFPQEADNADRWPTAAQLLPHAVTVTGHPEASAADPRTVVSLLNRVGGYLWWRAEYRQAKLLIEQALSAAEVRLGANDPETAVSLHALALVLHADGELHAARTFHERALAIRETRLGPGHPDTAHSLNDLATVLYRQGDLQGARSLHERALAIHQSRLEPDHSIKALNLNNLARVVSDQGDLQTARTLHEQALAIRESRLGVDHPDTAHSLRNLATVLYRQGDLQGARSLHKRALTVLEARLGLDHPDTAHSLNDLATVLHAQGDLEGARAALHRAIIILSSRLGPEHPDTAHSLDNLATVLYGLDDLPAALDHHKRALAIREARLGLDHPATAESLRNLATVLRSQGDLEGAWAALKRARSIYEARLGSHHSETVRSQGELVAVEAELDQQDSLDYGRSGRQGGEPRH